ncbi:MAG: SH3 domain-containing protein [Bacteriovoracaceae bacterium]|nr:SH3 domain-containing protein [Bacteriovoracaceae bacterium]
MKKNDYKIRIFTIYLSIFCLLALTSNLQPAFADKQISKKDKIYTKSGANLRKEANINGEKICALIYGTEVQVLDSKGDWRFIEVPLYGRVPRKVIRRSRIIERHGTDLLDTLGMIITTIPYGGRVQILKTQGDRAFIVIYKTGWVHSNLLKTTPKLRLQSKVFYKISTGNVASSTDGQSPTSTNMLSLIGASAQLSVENLFRYHLNYMLAFDISIYNQVEDFDMPVGYDASLSISHKNLYKKLSPSFKLNFESIVAPGRVFDSVTLKRKNIMTSMDVMWVGLGISTNIKLFKRFQLAISPSFHYSLSAKLRSSDYDFEGSSSGGKLKLLGEFIYKRKYLLRAGATIYFISGDSELNYNEFTVQIGRSL